MTMADMSEDTSAKLSAKADRHLWGHFARHGPGITPPIITRGEGVRIWDSHGKSYLDALSGLFVVQVGHGRAELAETAARQANTARVLPAVVLCDTAGDRTGRTSFAATRRAT